MIIVFLHSSLATKTGWFTICNAFLTAADSKCEPSRNLYSSVISFLSLEPTAFVLIARPYTNKIQLV